MGTATRYQVLLDMSEAAPIIYIKYWLYAK